jgi:hypothetical protein
MIDPGRNSAQKIAGFSFSFIRRQGRTTMTLVIFIGRFVEMVKEFKKLKERWNGLNLMHVFD